MEAFKPKHIRPWFEQVNYQGENFDDYYVVIFRFFRCTPVERANFNFIREHLKDSGAPVGGVIFPNFTDEIMGRRYYVMVRKDCAKALRMADMYAERIKRKGSLDPEAEDVQNRKAIWRTWKTRSLISRVNLCHEAGVSCFLARHDYPKHERLVALMSEAA